MSTIFPGSASVGQIFDGYSFDGTAWNIIGNEFNPTYFSPTAPDNPKAGDLWVDSSSNVPSISPETILTTTAAASTYVSKTTIPAFRLYQSTPQTITTGTNTALLFDSEDLDTDNGHSTVTNTSRYTATVAGWYMVTGTLQIAHNTTGNRIVFIRKNGSFTVNQVGRQTSSATNTLGLQISTMIYLNGTTDYLELMAFQSSGGNLDTLTANPSYFEGFWVRS